MSTSGKAYNDGSMRTRNADELRDIYLLLDPERAARLLTLARDMLAARQAGVFHMRPAPNTTAAKRPAPSMTR